MATVRDNILMEGLSGMFGGRIVFKNLRGKTIVTARPAPPARQSEQQRTNRSKFKDASTWAKEILKDATKKEYYQKKAKKLNLPNAYTAAITDYMRTPKVIRSFQEKEGTNYNVTKKGFDLKKVEVIFKETKHETRPAHITCGSEWSFLLTPEEQRQGVYIRVVDAADCVSMLYTGSE